MEESQAFYDSLNALSIESESISRDVDESIIPSLNPMTGVYSESGGGEYEIIQGDFLLTGRVCEKPPSLGIAERIEAAMSEGDWPEPVAKAIGSVDKATLTEYKVESVMPDGPGHYKVKIRLKIEAERWPDGDA